MMKTVPHAFNAEHTDEISPPEGKQSHSSRIHYILAGVLLFIAYLLSILIGPTPDITPSTGGTGFLLYWLGGGLITLLLLTIAAKR